MSETTRRAFLHVAAAGGAVVGVGGLSALTEWVWPRLPGGVGAVDPMANFRPPMAEELDDASHVLNRMTFGVTPGDHARVTAMGAKAFIREQLAPMAIEDHETERRSRHFEALDAWPAGELLEHSPQELLDQMTRDKIHRAVSSRRQLYEVMVDFWSDHFNIDPSKGDSRWLKPMDDRRVIREHAMGRFADMVKASAVSPAMLWYLDGRVNRRASDEEKPNENYARELLELHTLGVHGEYTQRDVMEVARCLTGWTVRERSQSRFGIGRVEFRTELHDDGAKEVLGTAIPAGLGEGDLERVIELVSHHPATARHLAQKLCQRFIADEPDEGVVKAVADAFVRHGGDIPKTLEVLIAQEAFWASRGTKIKRPFHFVVSALRATGAQSNGGPELQDYLLRMGHAPFQCPTPDGYAEEPQPWMATLLWRWRFAAELAANGIKGTRVQPERLKDASGGDSRSLAAHLLGRRATDAELEAMQESGAPLALLLASPAFQVC